MSEETTTPSESTSEKPAGNSTENRDSKRPGGDRPRRDLKKRFVFRKKFCRFCKEQTDDIDYKNIELLMRYTKSRGKILPRRFTGNCPRHQRLIAAAIKRARAIALLPYVSN